MSGTRVVCLSFILAAFGLISCSDVYGPPDLELDIDAIGSSKDEGGEIEETAAWFSVTGFVLPLSITAFRRVDVLEAPVEPVPSFFKEGQKMQVLPGILVEVFFDYVIVRDCSLLPALEAYGLDEEYWEVYQVGVADNCTINLPSDDLAGQTSSGQRPSCKLMGWNKGLDSGKPFLVRTGPNGTIRLQLRYVDEDPTTPIDSMYYKLSAFAAGASASYQGPGSVNDVCGKGT